MVAQPIEIPRLAWMRLVASLRKRGKGRRESGAFLLAKASAPKRRVEAVAYYDDLDPGCLDTGYIEFRARGYSTLWEFCEKRGLKAVADVHTHPGPDVGQSRVDRAHPMIAVAGHIAMILPHFGASSPWSLVDAGIYIFEGGGRWTTVSTAALDCPVHLRLW